MRQLEIDGHLCDFEWLRDYGYLPPQPWESQLDPSKNILMLNDDCLRHIFEQNGITFKELCRLAIICKRFNRITSQIIQSKARRGIKIKQLSHFSNKPLWKIDALLSAFGPSITALTIESHSDILPELIMNNCENIQTIKYNVEDFSRRPPLIGMRRLITELTSFIIHINHGFDVDLSLLFGSNSKLQSLRIDIKTNYMLQMPHIRLPQLEKLQICNCDAIDMDAFRPFLNVNTQLKMIIVKNASGQCMEQFTNIVKSLPNQIDGLTWYRYGQKHSLRIQISENRERVAQMPVERPRFVGMIARNWFRNRLLRGWMPFNLHQEVVDVNDDDEFMATIRSKKSMKRIKINGINDYHMIRLAQELNQLEEIFIDSHEITFNGIRTALQTGMTLTKATFYMVGRRQFDNLEIGIISGIRDSRNIQLKVVNDLEGLRDVSWR